MRWPTANMLRLHVTSFLAVALAGNAAAGEFMLRLGGASIDGPNEVNLQHLNTRFELTDGIIDGDSRNVALSFTTESRWMITVRHSRETLHYGDPQISGCGLNVGLVTGFDYCQPGVPVRDRTIADRGREWAVEIEHGLQLAERVSAFGAIGYGTLRWGSRDDLEAATFSTCLLEPPLWTRPDCVPVGDRAQSSGWTAGLRASFDITPAIAVSTGARWQGYQHDVYRYDALARFLDAARRPCEPFNWCEKPAERFQGGRTSRRDDWWWYTAAIDWDIGAHWTLGIDGAWGGDRDWETLGASIAYRW